MSQSPAPAETHVRKFGIRDKFGYLFGELGNDFLFMFASSFLMVFYTDVFKINAAAVGILFLVARLWDAFADVTWGRFIDTRKSGKHGKFRPWIFRMSLPLVILSVLMYVKIPGMGSGFYLAWAFVTYIVWGTLYSTVNIPYGSMASVITNDPVERTTLSTWRNLGSSLAGIIVNVLGPLLLFVNNQASGSRFITVGIIFGLLSLASYISCYKMSTERVTLAEDKTNKPKGNFGKTLKGLGKNKPLLWILIASLLYMCIMLLMSAVNVYLFKDYFGNAKVLSIVGLIQMGTVFVILPFIKPLVARYGKKEISTVGMFVAGAVYILLYLLPNLTAAQFISILIVGMLGVAIFQAVLWAFVTDVIDYHEYVTGLREDGTVYSIYSFARKVGQAAAGGIGGAALTAVGYNVALKAQPQSALNGIHMLATLIPGIAYLVIALILLFLYPLTKKRTLQMTHDLSEKRNAET